MLILIILETKSTIVLHDNFEIFEVSKTLPIHYILTQIFRNKCHILAKVTKTFWNFGHFKRFNLQKLRQPRKLRHISCDQVDAINEVQL